MSEKEPEWVTFVEYPASSVTIDTYDDALEVLEDLSLIAQESARYVILKTLVE